MTFELLHKLLHILRVKGTIDYTLGLGSTITICSRQLYIYRGNLYLLVQTGRSKKLKAENALFQCVGVEISI